MHHVNVLRSWACLTLLASLTLPLLAPLCTSRKDIPTPRLRLTMLMLQHRLTDPSADVAWLFLQLSLARLVVAQLLAPLVPLSLASEK